MQQDKIDFNNIKISVGGIEIPTENFDDTNIEIHPKYIAYTFKFKSNKKYNNPKTFCIKYDGVEIINKNCKDIKDFKFEVYQEKDLFKHIINFKAKYGSDTQILCEKYSVHFY